MLDAGCGSGRDSLTLLARGHEVTAFDGSTAMVRLASRRLGFPVLQLSFDQVRFEGGFDGVWTCASLLHVPRRDMLGVLCRLAGALKPRGVLYASFRCGDSETMRGGRLFIDYREESFRDMLQDQRMLQPIKLWRTSVRSSRAYRCCLAERAIVEGGGSARHLRSEPSREAPTRVVASIP